MAMLLDLIFAVVLILALMKGYHRGLILGIFSFVALFIGLVAALKLSAVVATRLGKTIKVSTEWLPLISFVIVFIVVILLIRLGAKALEKTIEMAMLGFVNRLGGMIFFAAIYLVIYSVLLFYLVQMGLIKPGTIHSSLTYSFVAPWGPRSIEAFGSLIPWFKNMFAELSQFFESVSKQISSL